MNAEQAVKLAKSHPGLVAILIEATPAVVGEKNAEKMEARGVEFARLFKHRGKIISIPGAEPRDTKGPS